MKLLRATAFALGTAALAGPASAATDINFVGTLDNACTLTVPVHGTLQMNAAGTELNSEIGPTDSAAVTIASVGKSNIDFSAPSLAVTGNTDPYDDTNEVVQLKYEGVGGLASINQPYTNASSGFIVPNISTTVLTLDARVQNSDSFVDGTYTITTTLTCS